MKGAGDMDYIDWEYYNSLYSSVAEDDFSRLNSKASAKLDVFTHMRAKNFVIEYVDATATDWQKQVAAQIKNTVCELIEKIYEQESSGAGSGVTSVSNDGYSESYKITTQAEKDAELRAVAVEGLSGTGLTGAL